MLGILVPINIIKDYVNLTNISKVNPNSVPIQFSGILFKILYKLILTNQFQLFNI